MKMPSLLSNVNQMTQVSPSRLNHSSLPIKLSNCLLVPNFLFTQVARMALVSATLSLDILSSLL